MKFWIIILIIVITACNRSNYTLPEKEKLADKILHRVALQMKQEAELRTCGTMGQMLNEIQKLGLSFCYFNPVDIAKGRKLLIRAAEALMKEMNEDERIRPYLSRHPVRPWNIEIIIFLQNSDNSEFPPGSLIIISITDGILKYKIDHPNKMELITVYKETYQEALDRIADPTLPLAQFEPDFKLSPEELARLRKNIRYLSNEGRIYHLGENGAWVENSKK